MHSDLLRRLLPDDDPDDLILHEGQFHHVVIGSDRVVCLGRTDAARSRMAERAAVLRTVAALDIGVSTPVPLTENVDGVDGPPYLVVTRISGAPLPVGMLASPQVAEAAARQFAVLLTNLAAAAKNESARAALKTSEGEWQRFAAAVRAELFPLMADHGREAAERQLTALDALPYLVGAVVHGDLGGANVLWEISDGVPYMSGVIDWDEASLGDPAEDLAAIGASYGDEFVDRVIALGGWASDAMMERMTAIRGTFALQQALYALRDGDKEQLEDGLTRYR